MADMSVRQLVKRYQELEDRVEALLDLAAGPQGPQGAQGAQGLSGEKGGQGEKGDQGTPGAQPSAMWPVGSVYICVPATDPSVLLGFGTWVEVQVDLPGHYWRRTA